MDRITYHTQRPRKWYIVVKLGGKIVGRIQEHKWGFHYKPTGAPAGDTFKTVEQVKASIEGERV